MGNLYQGTSRALKSAGWRLYRQGKGSHEIWWHLDNPDGNKILLPSNLNKPHLAEAIMRAAGLDKNAYKHSKRVLKKESLSDDRSAN